MAASSRASSASGTPSATGLAAAYAAANATGLPGADVDGAAGGGHDDLLSQIGELKKQQQKLKAEKKCVAKDLKNAERRRKRLRKKAKQLSDTDLIAVLRMRQQMGARASEESPGPQPIAPPPGVAGADVADDVGEE